MIIDTQPMPQLSHSENDALIDERSIQRRIPVHGRMYQLPVPVPVHGGLKTKRQLFRGNPQSQWAYRKRFFGREIVFLVWSRVCKNGVLPVEMPAYHIPMLDDRKRGSNPRSLLCAVFLRIVTRGHRPIEDRISTVCDSKTYFWGLNARKLTMKTS